MTNLLDYILDDVRSKKINKAKAFDLIKQFKTGRTDNEAGLLHPLLHQNTSDLSEQRFSSTFSGREFFLNDHVIQGQKTLPGVCYLEMAGVAMEKAGGPQKEGTSLQLKNVVWSRPITVNSHAKEVHIALFGATDGRIHYEVYTAPEHGDEVIVHSQGVAEFKACGEVPGIDLENLKSQMNQGTLSAETCYHAFTRLGLHYGAGHQAIREIYRGDNQILAKLILPSSIQNTLGEYDLHPSLMDAALQSSIGLMLDSDLLSDGTATDSADIPGLKPSLPFALESLEISGSCSKEMLAWVRHSEGNTSQSNVQKLDIDLCDQQGKVCVKMRGFSSRVLDGEGGSYQTNEQVGTLLTTPIWKETPVPADITPHEYSGHRVILCEIEGVSANELDSLIPKSACVEWVSTEQSLESRFTEYAVRCFESVQEILKQKPPGNVLIQIVTPDTGDRALFAGLAGLLKTARLENSKVVGQLIRIDGPENSESLAEKLTENGNTPYESSIKYVREKRFVSTFKESNDLTSPPEIVFQENGVYLITGGLGGLGRLFAKEILKQTQEAKIILTGRSDLTAQKEIVLKELQSQGRQVIYRKTDVSDFKQVTALIESIQNDAGKLTGIIHSAGIVRDNFILKKTRDEFKQVLAPKVNGTMNLDKATHDLTLDFFVLFSSTTGAMGNIGQADYAVANAFMDHFATYRNDRVLSNERTGQTLSINWPLWKEGGMTVDAATEEMMTVGTGMVAMETEVGIQAFYQGLALKPGQLMVMAGDLRKIRQISFSEKKSPLPSERIPKAALEETAVDKDSLVDKLRKMLVQKVSKTLKLGVEDIDLDTELSEFGFDSITLTEFTNQLNQKYSLELIPTLFYEYPTLSDFARYLSEEHESLFTSHFRLRVKTSVAKPVETIDVKEAKRTGSTRRRSRFRARMPMPEAQVASKDSVAIIGMSGTFPMAADIGTFWENLTAGKDCITEIPPDRWDWKALYGDPHQEPNKTNIKWGGFIEGVGDFDSLFFGISPREAELMDPQQRLLMTYSYLAIEDAGYDPQSLSGSHTGIFIGTGSSGYSGLIAKAGVAAEGYTSTGMVPSVGPNRVSYLLNLHGPSEPIETACSSSLVAIHRAVSAMDTGDCEAAIVGGVNTILVPNAHISFNKAGMLCKDGRCKTFSSKADGYVRGEGVGMLFLKPLNQAKSAGDHIYAVIRGSAENHGGKANSLTAPNPKAQAELLKSAYTKAGIDPTTVSYIEAHGTGTELGDPVEINGLKTAFKALYAKAEESSSSDTRCGLGSVKSNIGHLELAAGIAGVIKVLLQFKHKTLVKTLHCQEQNPYIKLEGSPFYIVRENKEWVALKDGAGNDIPRRAGVSSFGFGGVNAHIVLEEYISQKEVGKPAVDAIGAANPVIVPLSAKNQDRLYEGARNLLRFLRNQLSAKTGDHDPVNLVNLSYTLQVGREAMEERLGLIVSSLTELEEKLEGFLEGKDDIDDCYRGRVKPNQDTLSIFTMDEDLLKAMDAWIAKGKYAKLLDLWVKGLVFDWHKLYGDSNPGRISLPTYPFAKERHWVRRHEGKSLPGLTPDSGGIPRIHPLLHQNTSDLSEQRFSSTFSGREFFLDHHRVNGQKVLPGVAYLEMAGAAVKKAGGRQEEGTSLQLKHVVWSRPITVDEHDKEVHIALFEETAGRIQYEVYTSLESEIEEDVIVHSQGVAEFKVNEEVPGIDIETLKSQMNQGTISADICYQAFKALGLDYGPGHQAIREIYPGENQTLAKLVLASSIENTLDDYVLHPGLMDAAIQSSMGLSFDPGLETPKLTPSLPFALESLEIFGSCTLEMFAWVRYSEGSTSKSKVRKLDIDLCDDQGTVCVKMRGFSSRALDEESGSSKANSVSTISSFDGEPIGYHVQGCGRIALVFVHGLGSDHTFWDRQVSHFSSLYTVVTVDLAGHGGSGTERTHWTIEKFGLDVAAVIKHLDLKQVILVGHSLGGPVMLEASSLIVERVIGLVGADTLHNLEPKQLASDQVSTFIKEITEEISMNVHSTKILVKNTSDQDLVKMIDAKMLSVPSEVIMGTYKELLQYSDKINRDFPVPLVLINSSDYIPTNLEAASSYGVEVKLMTGVGHYVMLEDPVTFNRLLEETVSQYLETNNISPENRLLIAPIWKEKPVSTDIAPQNYSEHRVILCEIDGIPANELNPLVSGSFGVDWGSDEQSLESRFTAYAIRCFETIQEILIKKPSGKVLIQIVTPDTGDRSLFAGLTGLLKTARLENPNILGQLILIDGPENSESLAEKLKENQNTPYESSIKYAQGKRLVSSFEELNDLKDPPQIAFKDNGVYLITGGLGGLGIIFAEEILKQTQGATIILTGRSELSTQKESLLKELQSQEGPVDYQRVNVSDLEQVTSLIESIQNDYGKLTGIIHCAGVILDGFIVTKTKDEFKQVLAPKVNGVVNLDKATHDLTLDFFVLFSSIAGAMGNTGQADYAAANAFMDRFAAYRNDLVSTNRRTGQTLSINWPLWKEGGMTVDAATEEMMRNTVGMTPLDTEAGIRAFYDGLALGYDQLSILAGDVGRLRTLLVTDIPGKRPDTVPADGIVQPEATLPDRVVAPVDTDSEPAGVASSSFRETVEEFITKLLATTLKIPAHKILSHHPMEKYGIDSVLALEMTNRLEQTFGLLPKTLFFEHQTIEALAGYFMESHSEVLTGKLQLGDSAGPETKPITPPVAPRTTAKRNHRRNRLASMIQTDRQPTGSKVLDIAVIGMAGRYPQAENLEEYWNNLRDGKDCITEVPEERWDWREYYSEDRSQSGSHFSKWGGFIRGVDEFDSLFFNISPMEAVFSDPQERLFLQHVWMAIEDAGYTRQTLRTQEGHDDDLPGQVGVYVGMMYGEYQLFGEEHRQSGKRVGLSSSYAGVANRVSYVLNLHGPSLTLDTMCSSSLTAIHLACQDLILERTNLGIAGGVNVTIHPNKYMVLSMGQFISTRGHCESFGEGGDGYIPGEGVGVVLLKRTADAERDGDHIYGVIKGSSVNHGGKTNGYSVPNPVAQQKLIEKAFKEAAINPRTVSYIEAHGTGTKLGDPIEISGLTKAFRKNTTENGFCRIGSAKSNIGHCESAAGVAGFTKVLLQLKHGQIAPSLHSETLNPHIDFDNTPFIVNQRLLDWQRPVIDGLEMPRRAGISAFGAGGSNAHIILEEYRDRTDDLPVAARTNPVLVPLSAKDKDRLTEMARNLAAFLRKTVSAESSESHRINVTDMAYTLQVGREVMKERLALVVDSIEDLIEKLEGFVNGNDTLQDLYHGRVKHNQNTLSVFTADEELRSAIESWITKGKLPKLADLWVNGLAIDWNKLYPGAKPQRIGLPTYPFAKKKHWVSKVQRKTTVSSPTAEITAVREDPWEELPSLVPVWNPIVPEKLNRVPVSSDAEILLVGGDRKQSDWLAQACPRADRLELPPQATVETIQEKLAERSLDRLIWIAPDDSRGVEPEHMIDEQEQGVYQCFRIVKALLNLGYGTQTMEWTVVTFNTQAVREHDEVMPTHSGVIGLIGSLAKELPHWNLRLLDVESLKSLSADECLSLPYGLNGNPFAYRGSQWFQQELSPVTLTDSESTLYKEQGVYVVIGGAGGLGEVWSRFMIERYHAHIVWIGRREKNDSIQKAIDRLAVSDRKPMYISANAADVDSLRKALDAVEQRHAQINGVVQSAVILRDQTLGNMEEADFRASLSAKVDAGVNMDLVFGGLDLDFMLYFSSMQSFVKPPGQSNYAAGCVFKDSLAQMADRKSPYPVKSMNWGYWGSTGVVADESYQKQMEKSGIGSIEPDDAMKALSLFVGSPWGQMGLIRVLSAKVTPFLEKVTAAVDTGGYPLARPEAAPIDIKAGQPVIITQASQKEINDFNSDFDAIYSDICGIPVLRSLQTMGFFHDIHPSIAVETLYDTVDNGSALNPLLLNTVLHVLKKSDWIELKDDTIVLTETGASEETQARIQNFETRISLLNRAFPEFESYLGLLKHCLENLPELFDDENFPATFLKSQPVADCLEGIRAVDPENTESEDDPFVKVIWENLKWVEEKKRVTIVDLGCAGNRIGRAVVSHWNRIGHEAEYHYIEGSETYREFVESDFRNRVSAEKGRPNTVIFRPAAGMVDLTANVGQPNKADIVIIPSDLTDHRNLEGMLEAAGEILHPNGWILAGEHPSPLTELTRLVFGPVENRLLRQGGIIDSGKAFDRNSVFGEAGFRTESIFGDWLVLAWRGSERPIEVLSATDGTESTVDFLIHLFSSVLNIEPADLELDTDLPEYGLDSILVAQAYIQLKNRYEDLLSPKDLVEYTTIKKLADFIDTMQRDSSLNSLSAPESKHPVIEPATAAGSVGGQPAFIAEIDKNSMRVDRNNISSDRTYEIITCGEGEPIVFLTGLAFTWRTWKNQIALLRDRYRLIIPHLPGHGTSVSESGSFDFGDLIADLMNLVDHYSIDTFHLIGWCAGGNISQYLAAKHSDRLKTLTLIGTTPTDARLRGVNTKDLVDYSNNPLDTYVLEFKNCLKHLPQAKAISEKYLKFLEGCYYEVDSVHVMNYIENLFRFDSTNLLKDITAPTTVMAGKWDIAFPISQVKRVHAGIPNSKIIEFDHSGHLPFITEEEKFNQALLAFLMSEGH